MNEDKRNPQLSEEELDGLLAQWESPLPSNSLRQRIFGEKVAWWRRCWQLQVSLPVPAMAAALFLLVLAGGWLWQRPMAPQVIVRTQTVVRTERVEVPVAVPVAAVKAVRGQSGATGRRRAAVMQESFGGLHPVSAFRPVVIGGYDGEN
jgi:hypothetical protein